MIKQEIYDIVVSHLRTMKCQSINKDGNCAYRGQNGNKCAIGILIPDDVYCSEMDNSIDEGIGMNVFEIYTNFPAIRKIFQKSQLPFLGDMQFLHDYGGNWGYKEFVGEEAIHALSERYNLKYVSPSMA